MITRTFKLYLNSGNTPPLVINVNQYDQEVWIFNLYSENGRRFIPTTGSIIGIKSDGKSIANSAVVDERGYVIVNVTEQMTASAGKAEFELLLENETHGTANFTVMVEKRPGDGDMSESDLSMLQEVLDELDTGMEVVQQALDAFNSVFKITFTVNASSPSYATTCDKTYAQITEALNTRKEIDAHIIYLGQEDPRMNTNTVYEKVVLIERNANNIYFYGASMTYNDTKTTQLQMKSNGNILFLLVE